MTEAWKNWWEDWGRRIAYVLIGIAVLAVVVIVVLNRNEPWTGFGKHIAETSNKTTPFEGAEDITKTIPAKTLWDWLDLVIVAAVIAGGLFLLNTSQKKREEVLEQDREEQTMLESYYSRMEELLLKHNLRSENNDPDSDDEPIIARAWTLTVLRNLNKTRKSQVVRFVYEAGLIRGTTPIVRMKNADLSGADLRKAHLRDANLRWANLERADLQGADLRGANVSEADLRRTNLSKADLGGADLRGTNLSGAKLKDTGLLCADLRGADLSGAELTNIDLRGVKYLDDDKSEEGLKNKKGLDLTCAIPFDNDGNPWGEEGTVVSKDPMAASTGDIEEINGPVPLKKETRDLHFRIASNWEARGKPTMQRFDLSRRDLSNRNLANAELQESNLSETDLRGTDLRGAKLGGAYLNGAKLGEADLRGADLSGAKLTEAELLCADLRGADLRTSEWESIYLLGAKYTKATSWPDGFDPKNNCAIEFDNYDNPIPIKNSDDEQ